MPRHLLPPARTRLRRRLHRGAAWALAQYATQVRPIPPWTEPVLSPEFIASFSFPEEFFFERGEATRAASRDEADFILAAIQSGGRAAARSRTVRLLSALAVYRAKSLYRQWPRRDGPANP
jgi:hypothetical protein